ncbi:MAG: hypothetical protein R2784_15675 [Saprospiraceae bacterium]
MDKITNTKEAFDYTFKSVLNQITVDISRNYRGEYIVVDKFYEMKF